MSVGIELSGGNVWPVGNSLHYPFELFVRRMILECLQESSADWWDRRAVQFDRVGNERCDEIADACRNKASFLRMYGDDDLAEDLAAVLADLEPTPTRAHREASPWAQLGEAA